MSKFKQEILDKIRDDSGLYMKVCEALGIKPVTLPKTLQRNGASLNQYSIVTLVASHLGVEPSEVVEAEQGTVADSLAKVNG